MRFAALLLLAVHHLPGQTIGIFSELRRVDPFGEILAMARIGPDYARAISPPVGGAGMHALAMHFAGGVVRIRDLIISQPRQ